MRCCRESLWGISQKLVGQLIYENQAESACVDIKLIRFDILRCFVARNRLTMESAFGLLHFFHHLRDVGILDVAMLQNNFRNWATPINTIVINRQLPTLIHQIGPSPDGRVGIIRCEIIGIDHELFDLRLLTLDRIFYYNTITFLLQNEDQLDTALRIVTGETRRKRFRSVNFSIVFEASWQTADHIISYLQHTAKSLERAIHSVFRPLDITEWPTSCPKESGKIRYPGAPMCRYYSFTNKSSGSRFEVALYYDREVDLIRDLRLFFHV